MPPAVQTALFRAVVAIGTLLGRYKGRDWPGCPERCVGAPTAFEQKPDAVTERTAELL